MVIISLFDESGNMVRHYAEEGHDCHCFDLLNDDRIEDVGKGRITFHKGDLSDSHTIAKVAALGPSLLFGFPPCTDLAVSGAKHFKAKAASNPLFQQQAMELFKLTYRLGESLGISYMIENPTSMASTLWRKPDYKFHPYQYGGYLPEDDIHPRWPKYITARDAYPKTTYLWLGNGFVIPEHRSVPIAEGYAKSFNLLGGKSKNRSIIRSETPRGFAKAVFLYNP